MFEKFTDKARRVVTLSQEEARKSGRKFVGTEHLLLALVKEDDSVAGRALKSLDVTYDECIATLKIIPEDGSQDGASGHIPFTPRAKHVLEVAYREMMKEGSSYIATEHLLLGLVAESDCQAMKVLSSMGVSADAIVNEVNEIRGSNPQQRERGKAGVGDVRSAMGGPAFMGGPSQSSRGGNNSDDSTLADYGRNLTDLAREGKLDPVIGRDREVERVMQVMARRQKNNPLILGDPGVGKTAIVEGLAQLIASGNVPEILRDKEIWTLDVAALVAGSKFRGEFEERLKQVVNEVSGSDKIILFIDELHTIIGAGSAEGSLDAASILKPALSRGEIQVIGATTADEYRKRIEKDSALERRFQPVNIGEPSLEDTLEILHGLRSAYEEHHHVNYTEEALSAAVTLSDRYIQDRFLPDKAIDLLDEAGARTRVSHVALPPELAQIDEELARVRQAKSEAASAQEFEEAARLRDEERELTAKKEELDAAWREELNKIVVTVEESDIADVVSSISGVPVSNLTEGEASKLLRCEQVLHERVIGQNEAVSAVSRAIRRSRSPLKDPRRPGGSFIFLGPSGVGKTELAKALAEFLFGTEDALISFDMSEFMEKHSVSKLVGAPPGYVGYDEGGELTKAVRRRPYSVILFDEIEKAHPDVFNILLQILDEGRLTDGQGRPTDFSNTVVIMTSNIGARDIAQTTTLGFTSSGEGLSDNEINSRVMSELKKLFRPEFLNRVDEIVVFKSLSAAELRGIVGLMVEDLRKRLYNQQMSIQLSDAASDLVAKRGTDKVYGARPLRRAIQTMIEDPLSEQMLSGKWSAGDIIYVDVAEDAETLTFEKRAGEIMAPKDREHMEPARSRSKWTAPRVPSSDSTAVS